MNNSEQQEKVYPLLGIELKALEIMDVGCSTNQTSLRPYRLIWSIGTKDRYNPNLPDDDIQMTIKQGDCIIMSQVISRSHRSEGDDIKGEVLVHIADITTCPLVLCVIKGDKQAEFIYP
jgi:hypothetical protein